MTTRHEVLKAISTVGTAIAVSSSVLLDDAVAYGQEASPISWRFHLNGKAPSQYMLDLLKKARASLPFSDTVAFDFIPTPGRVGPRGDYECRF